MNIIIRPVWIFVKAIITTATLTASTIILSFIAPLVAAFILNLDPINSIMERFFHSIIPGLIIPNQYWEWFFLIFGIKTFISYIVPDSNSNPKVKVKKDK